MVYFPLFLNFTNKRILIVGGGNIAYEKLKHLLKFSKNITILAKKLNKKITKLVLKNSLDTIEKEYQKNNICDFDIVIVAVDNLELQESIFFETRETNCLCNCVDLQQYCDFIFPSYIKRGDLTIAISTNGSSPALAKNLRIYLEKLLPKDIDKFLVKMRKYRQTMPKGAKRMKFLEKKAKKYLKKFK